MENSRICLLHWYCRLSDQMEMRVRTDRCGTRPGSADDTIDTVCAYGIHRIQNTTYRHTRAYRQ